MTNLSDEGFRATAYWGPRAETPAKCAKRFQQLLSALSAIHPSFSEWSVVHEPEAAKLGDIDALMDYMDELTDAEYEAGIVPFASMSRRQVTEWIAEGVSRDDDGTPDSTYGYHFGAATGPDKQTSPRTWSVSITAGITATFDNKAKLESRYPSADNADLNTLQIFKPAMLALTKSWDASWCGLCPAWSLPEGAPVSPWFGFQWATYLGPALAKHVTPPQSAAVERFADGALLMIATEDRFDPDNPKHMAAAQAIAAALAPAGIVVP